MRADTTKAATAELLGAIKVTPRTPGLKSALLLVRAVRKATAGTTPGRHPPAKGASRKTMVTDDLRPCRVRGARTKGTTDRNRIHRTMEDDHLVACTKMTTKGIPIGVEVIIPQAILFGMCCVSTAQSNLVYYEKSERHKLSMQFLVEHA